jgi:hypothetical protein
VRGGFPDDVIAQLTAGADAVASALEDRANTKVRRVERLAPDWRLSAGYPGWRCP